MNAPADALLARSEAMTVTMANTGTAPGFVPVIDLIVPTTVTIGSTDVAGRSVSPLGPLLLNPTTPVNHPVSGAPITGPVGTQLYVVRLPLSSQAPGLGALTSSVAFTVQNSAAVTVGSALSLSASCGFAYGADALNNRGTDAPIYSAPQTGSVVPRVVMVTSQFQKPNVCQGTVEPTRQVITVDIAQGVTLSVPQVSAVLGARFQITGATSTGGGVVTPPTGPGGTVLVSYGAVTGAAGPDLTVNVDGYVINGTVAQATPGTSVQVSNVAHVHGVGSTATAIPYVRNAVSSSTPAVNVTASVRAHAMRVDEALAPVPSVPGQLVDVTLSVCVASDFSLQQVSVASVLPDGTSFQNNAVPPGTATGSNPTTVTFTLGSPAAGSVTPITFRTQIEQAYASTAPVRGGDVLLTTHTASARVGAAGATFSATEANSGTDASLRATAPTVAISIAAINGTPGPARFDAGDVVTFQVDAALPSGDQGNVVLDVFLPPVFTVTQRGASGSATAASPFIRLAAAHDAGTPVPWTTSAAENRLRFTVAPVTGTTARTIRLLADFTVGSAPVEDGLILTTPVSMSASASGATTVTGLAIVEATLDAPVLTVTLTPASTVDVDAGATFTYTLRVINVGHSSASAVTLRQILPTNISASVPTGGVTDGTGTPLAFTGDLIATDLVLTNPVPTTGGGLNTVVVTVNATVGAVPAGTTLTTTGRVVSYQNGSGGTYPAVEANATVQTKPFVVTATRPGATPLPVTIGDVVPHTTTITVPEGITPSVVLSVALDPELEVVGTPVVALGGVGTGSTTVAAAGNGFTVTLGTVTNGNNNDGVLETITVTYNVRVANLAAAQDNDDAVNADSSLTWNGLGPLVAAAGAMDIEEPDLQLALISSPSTPAQAGDTVTWVARVTVPTGVSVPAYDVSVQAIPPTTDLTVTSVTVSGVAGTNGVNEATWVAQSFGQTATVTVQATIEDTAQLGATLSLPLALTWTSLPGIVTGERTGLGGVNDYARAVTGTVDMEVGLTLANTRLAVEPSSETIGDLVEYQLTVTMPHGTYGHLILEHQLRPELEFVSIRGFGGGPLLCKPAGSGGSFSACTAPTATVAGNTVSWDFGAVRYPKNEPAPGQLTLISRTRIRNVATALAGLSFTTRAAVASLTQDSVATVIKEPAVTASASLAPTSGVDGGDAITISGTITNPLTLLGRTAYDVAVTHPTTAGLSAISAASADCSTSLVFVPATFTVGFTSVPLGTACHYTVTAQVSDTIAASSTISLTNLATWTSREGVDPAERTGSGTPALNSYRLAGTLPDITTLGGSLAMTTGLSGEPGSVPPALFAGETVVYDVAVTVPDGTSPLAEVTFTPPPGVRVVSAALDTTGFVGTVPALTLVPGPRSSGLPARMTLGTVIATAGAGQVGNTFHILVSAAGTFDARNRATPAGQVTASLRIGGGAPQPVPVAPPVELQLPRSRLVLSASRTDAGVGATFDLTATLANAPAPVGPLCDTLVSVSLPRDVTAVDPAGDGLDNDGDGATDEADEDAIAPTSPVMLPVAGCLQGTRALALRLTVGGAAPLPHASLAATLAPYYTLADAAHRERLLPATDAFDSNGSGGVDEVGDETVLLPLRPDSDSDGLSDLEERDLGLDPLDSDCDDDGVRDGSEPQLGTDFDGDGLINARDADSDNDGLFDGTERGITAASPGTNPAAGAFIPDADSGATTTDPVDRDSDNGGRSDGAEDFNHNGAIDGGERNPNLVGDDGGVADADNDGLADAEEAALGTSPVDNDSDDDGVLDGLEPNYVLDTDGDGLTQARDADSDNDAVLDGTELGITAPASGTDVEAGRYQPDADGGATRTSPLLADTDRGGVRDGEEDLDRNGQVGVGERDPRVPGDDAAGPDFDADGWSDAFEAIAGTSPLDPDSDDDGAADGAEPNGASDSDGDGEIGARDADSDNDGVFDGTELGVAEPAPRGTELAAGRYRPDAQPATRTSPVRADSDGGGVPDGAEDPNRNGRIDAGETDPQNRADDAAVDSDGDGLANAQELAYGTDPADADSDDDGLRDGAEANPGLDSDGDGAIGALDPDSDSDGLYDGTERGVVAPGAGTNVTRGFFVADAQPATRTKMVVADTDRGGVSDGGEDRNKNGRVDAGETDPNLRADDAAVDGDGDGLVDAEETRLGTDPTDADSDDDGVLDGAERDYAADSDGDELPNALDVDSDDDGLYDGTELGVVAAGPATNVSRGHFVADADPSSRTSPVRADSDGGGVLDGNEDVSGNGRVDAAELDPRSAADDVAPADGDTDGLSNAVEARLGTDPADADSDDDGVPDGSEPNWQDDHDGDGLRNARDADSDDDLLFDGTESGVTTPGVGTNVAAGAFLADADPATHTNPLARDTDRGGTFDGAEDANRNGRRDGAETNPVLGQGADDGALADGDGDGLPDAVEARLGSSSSDRDSDDDGVADGAEPNLGWDADADGLPQLLDPDSDNDGLFDGTERGVTAALADTNLAAGNFRADADASSRTQQLLRDSDGGGARDGAEDLDKNGALDSAETDPNDPSDDGDVSTLDTDSDGLTDVEERVLNTRPGDADTDDDGVLDGAEPNLLSDADGDGLISPRDADSDGDGVFDGTELSLTSPVVRVAPLLGTDLTRGAYVADADPATHTQPQRADTDGGSVRDGREDPNHNGRVDAGETNPLLAGDDVAGADGDSDGLSDREELALGTSPTDADTDDDGVRDGGEPNWGTDSDGDGSINARDPDSDNDRLFDGTESGVTTAGVGTNIRSGVFRADTDPASRTSPLLADSDGGGVLDGSEDIDRDGAFDGAPETDPNLASDDSSPRDSDGDRLPDAEEVALGTNPNDADSDDDGLLDGVEPNLVADSDGDGLINPLDPDSDDDGLYDGTESGVTQPALGTNRDAGNFVPDADPGTTTNPLAADTDGGGVPDGAEDPNGNGQVQAGELDPRSAGDDATPPPDGDGDGLSDAQEAAYGTAAMDGDSDDDGVLDGAEANPASDTDGDGADNPMDADSDGDGVLDGTERGVTAADLTADTDVMRGRFVADADPATTTFVLARDSDRGGVIDGLEDRNGNGAQDGPVTDLETNPRESTDDELLSDADGDTIYDVVEDVVDTDADGERDFVDLDADGDRIGDAVEAGDTVLATPPVDSDRDRIPDYRDRDADGDTVLDRTEAGDADLATPARDSDGDRVPDYLDLDADGDGRADAEEAGDVVLETAPVDTDGDGTPDILDLDSDGDGVLDAMDNCRILANPDQADENRNGIGNLCEGDDDGDGVLERMDNCPGLRNPEQADRDLDGIGDVCDPDANGDGLPDNLKVEGGCATGSGGGATGAVLLVLALLVGRRRRRGPRRATRAGGGLALLTLLALGAPQARAQGLSTEEPRAFSVERFRWALDEQGILGVESASVPAHGSWGASLWLGYARAPLVVYGEDETGRHRVGALVAYRLATELSGSLALFGRVELGLAAPLILAQDRDSMLSEVGPVSGLSATGFGDVRLTGKLTLLGRPKFALALAAAVTVPSSTGADYRGEDGVTVSPELVLARQQGRVRLGANLGWKMRSRTELLDLTVDDELYVQLGAGLPLRGLPLSVDGNLSLATAASGILSSANQNHAELLGGVSYDVPGPLVATLVGGLGLSDGAGTPQWRTLLALRFGAIASALADRDGDGLIGEADKCPGKPEDNDSFEDGDGCPEADNDRDGIVDVDDKLPQDPEDRDGFEDGDGAPDLDNDGDGVPDTADACRDDAETANGFDDQDGCPDALPDRDADKVRDVEDQCPTEPEDLDQFEDGDGCPDLDNDKDKVLDRADRCPTQVGPVDNGGCPDTDGDGDGVIDRLDNCPSEKGALRYKGCAERQLVAISAGKLELSEAVYFKSGRAEIEKRSFKLLDNAAAVLKAHPEVTRVDIEGHTDDEGDDEANKLLSQQRAEAVVAYLVGRGVAEDRLSAIGYGEERPIADNKRSRGRAANRRVVFRIVAGPGVAPATPAASPAAAPSP